MDGEWTVALFTKDGQQLTKFLPVEPKEDNQRITFADPDKLAEGIAVEARIHDRNTDALVQTVDLLENPFAPYPNGLMVEKTRPGAVEQYVDLNLFREETP